MQVVAAFEFQVGTTANRLTLASAPTLGPIARSTASGRCKESRIAAPRCHDHQAAWRIAWLMHRE